MAEGLSSSPASVRWVQPLQSAAPQTSQSQRHAAITIQFSRPYSGRFPSLSATKAEWAMAPALRKSWEHEEAYLRLRYTAIHRNPKNSNGRKGVHNLALIGQLRLFTAPGCPP